MGLIERLLTHPLTRGLDLDSPDTSALRRQIILAKPFLYRVYLDWYHRIVRALPEGEGRILEIGAGGGFLDTLVPDLLTSEVLPVPEIDLVADARALPVRSSSLKAIVMTNVLHHIPDVSAFFDEVERTLIPGGRVIMVEPWNTWWSRFVHRRFHDEPMIPNAPSWEFESTGPLSGANAALPWIVVERDRRRLEAGWRLRVVSTEPLMPLRYLVSGGVSLRSLQPRWMYAFWAWLDGRRILRRFSVFALVVLERR